MTIDDRSEPSPFADYLPGKRVVLFMDILGFRDLITRMPKEGHLFSAVMDLLRTVEQEVKNHYGAGPPSRLYSGEDSQLVSHMTQFSDSIVISYPFYSSDDPAAGFAILDAQRFTKRLFELGFFVRGGIACGWAYHDANVLFGAGIVAAYELESYDAWVPRIVVTDEVAKMLHDYQCERDLRKDDDDGRWFVNPFYLLMEGLVRKDLEENSCHLGKVVQNFTTVGEFILQQLKRAESTRPELLKKYRWLANQFNDARQQTFQGMNVSVPPIEIS